MAKRKRRSGLRGGVATPEPSATAPAPEEAEPLMMLDLRPRAQMRIGAVISYESLTIESEPGTREGAVEIISKLFAGYTRATKAKPGDDAQAFIEFLHDAVPAAILGHMMALLQVPTCASPCENVMCLGRIGRLVTLALPNNMAEFPRQPRESMH